MSGNSLSLLSEIDQEDESESPLTNKEKLQMQSPATSTKLKMPLKPLALGNSRN